jgi:hypothetical protein
LTVRPLPLRQLTCATILLLPMARPLR